MKTPRWFLTKNFTAILLWPLSLFYYIGHRINFACGKLFQKKYSVKTICVGNVMAGGTGKTPIILELAKFFKNAVVVSRGYKGIYSGEVKKNLSAKIVGDEPMMISNYAPIFVGTDRNKSIKQIIKKYKKPVILLDDAFQNPSVKYTLSILVFDGKIGLGNNFVLPAGPLRETLKFGLNRADSIIIIGQDKTGLRKKIESIKKIPVFFAENKLIAETKKKNLVAFSGIGYPIKFFNSLKEIGINPLEKISFSDHHFYTEKELLDLEKIAEKHNANLITTEKDWVRLPKKWQDKVLKTKLETTIEKKFYNWLEKELR